MPRLRFLPETFPGAGTPRAERARAVRRRIADRRGSIAVLAALCVVLLVGAAAMAIDVANLYLAKSSDQRIADQSALAAAFAYGQSSNSTTTAQSAASSLAVANGAGASTVATSIVNSPSGDGNKAAMVVVTTPVSLSPFGQITTASALVPAGLLTVNVTSTAYAEIQNQTTPCILALSSTGVSAVGGVNMTASSCAVSSDGGVTASNGARITAQAIYAVGAIGASGGASVTTSPSSGQTFPNSSAPVDPYAGANVFARLPTVAAMEPATFPSIGSAPSGGTSQTCNNTLSLGPGSYGTITTSWYPTCSTITFTGGTGTVTNISNWSISGSSLALSFGAGTYNINGFSVSGSTTVTMSVANGATMNFWGGIKLGGSSQLTVTGTATYNVSGGIANGSSSALVFNNGASGTSAFTVAGGIATSNGSVTFPNGSYTVTSGDGTAGIDVGNGGPPMTFGNGSFSIASGIYLSGGARLTIGAALNANSVFQIPSAASNGDAINTGGGSSLTLGSFTNYDINGALALAGNVSLGAGVYTINGALDASASGGDSISGTGVSLVAAGAFSFGAGYSSINLSAPTTISNTSQGTAGVVVLASESSTAATITAGATNTDVVGTIYLPNAALTLSGAGNLTGGGGCLELLASGVALTGGSSVSTSCSSLSGGNSAGTVALVQ